MLHINTEKGQHGGVPISFVCRLRKERMKAIGEELGKGEHDIILLQEIWDQADYKLLQEKMCGQYPYCHYFYSGIIGSGLCVFSKIPILDTCFHKNTLHGYPHTFLDGEWLAGKGIGLCKMEFSGLKINVYSTHVMGGDPLCYSYKTSHAFEMSEFIKLTSTDADFIIVGGDLNLESQDLGFEIISQNAELSDAWQVWSSKEGIKESGHTADVPSNCFTAFKGKRSGCRIDYLLYKQNKDICVDVEKCFLTMGQIPNKDFNFSDHEGLAAVFNIDHQKESGFPSKTKDIIATNKCLEAAISVLERGKERVEHLSYKYAVTALMCVFILYLSSSLHVPYGLNLLVTFIRVALTITAGACLWTRTVLKDSVKHHLTDTQENIKTLLKAKKIH